ncbi:hypothetical protein [Sphingomonas trueperi]|uniref:hypothetical protein n=1 Tax=Sphingomonas trueperi TaxID=53317 RepID=UPI000EB59B82
MAAFFMPFIDQNDWEDTYKNLPKVFGGIPKHDKNERVLAITWDHGGEHLTAQVGEQIKGSKTIETGRGREKRFIDVPASYGDTVIAIYPGHPFVIVHDNKSKVWNLPISAQPTSITYFEG